MEFVPQGQIFIHHSYKNILKPSAFVTIMFKFGLYKSDLFCTTVQAARGIVSSGLPGKTPSLFCNMCHTPKT